MIKPTGEKILSIEDVSKRLMTPLYKIEEYVRRGHIKATYFHGEWHIRESNLKKFVEKQDKIEKGEKTLLSIPKAALLLQVSEILIERGIQEKELRTVRNEKNSGIRIDANDLLKWHKAKFRSASH